MLKAIIVDDEQAILKGLNDIVQWEDYGIEIVGQATNGYEALRLIESMNIAILITDINMPEMDGLTLIREAKQRGFQLKSIILSGYDDFAYVKEAIKLGIENYLLKPIVRDELCSTLLNIAEKINQELYLQNQLRSDSLILRNNILNRWLTNNISQPNLMERSDLLQINLASSRYLICLFKVLYENHHDNSHRELLNFASENICYEILNAKGKAITLCDMSGQIAAILDDASDLRPEAIHGLLQECAASINKLLKCAVFVTVGSREHNCLDVYKSYSKAVELMNYSLIMPPNSIVDYEQITHDSFLYNEQIHIDYDHLQLCLSTKNTKQAVDFITDAFGKISHLKEAAPLHTYPILMDILFRILNTLNQTKINTDTLLNTQDTMFIHLIHAKNLDELQEWLTSFVIKAIEKMNAEDENMNPIIKRVLAFLETNYADNISLKTISHSFNVSAAYLGQLFIKEKGETFSNYLNRTRIEKAMELLATTGLELQEISEKVGYVNQSYFNLIFKKITGVYPSKYRFNLKSEAELQGRA